MVFRWVKELLKSSILEYEANKISRICFDSGSNLSAFSPSSIIIFKSVLFTIA